ncbi:hypothetical protein [Chryseobacterium sp. NKUCC03_KSP]|uniref:hypothetical protein n=1 Tax=Chryseobacterium sp. NKUCC03_KSP TaxID=2842125 RepID=UPI001C5A78D0|nr:hypothetical protein [Chryseobacterium sp. NKUCC03_KSP]MBW3524356.1 hypothetical protein [Chryseobacterium sp. NKUCC03_KSP]
MTNMLKNCPFLKEKKHFVFLSVLLLFNCNGNSNGNQESNKRINDTISVNGKVESVKNENKNLPAQYTENTTKNRLAGKTFVGKLSHSCRATTNGAYDIYIFLHLSFDRDSVKITRRRVDIETHIIDEKVYAWNMLGNKLIIDHFDDYSKLQIKTDRLIGTQYDGSTIEFLNSNVHHFKR